jgi:hypothetical protein
MGAIRSPITDRFFAGRACFAPSGKRERKMNGAFQCRSGAFS